MELLTGIAVGLLIAGIVAVIVRAAVGGGRPARAPEREPTPSGTLTITLDLGAADPADPAVARLAREAGSRALATHPAVDLVRVVRPDGTLLATVERHVEVAPPPKLPEQLSEPHRAARHRPDPTARTAPSARPYVAGADEADDLEIPADRPFADRFELPERVRRHVHDAADPVDVVRAVLSTAGRPARVDADVIRSGDVAIVVVGTDRGGPLTREQLNHAYLAFQGSGARSGLVLCLGFVRPDEVHRREMLAPALRHVGPEAVQRMADAVAVGADPLAFATGPPTVTTT